MRFKICEGQIPRWIETLSAYTFTVVHPAGRLHNNADSMSQRPCHSDHCKYCDRYERRYSPDTMADLTKIAGESGAVKRNTSKKGVRGRSPCPILGVAMMSLPLMMGATIVSLCLVMVPSRST